MKYLLNKFNLLLIFTFSSFFVLGQGAGHRVKATLKTNSTPGQIEVWFTPDFTNSTEYFDNLDITFSIPNTQATTNTVASLFSSEIASIPAGLPWAQAAVGLVNSEYIFTFVGNNSATTVSPFTLNTAFKVATFLFNDATMNMATVKLVDFTSTSGAPTGQSYLYISFGASGGISSPVSANKFYSGNGTIGNNGTDYFVSAGSPIVLPVTLVSFTAAKVGTGINLNWLVTSEINAKEYNVERSSGNGAAFIAIGNVAANNNGKYSFIDASPLGGVNYYRLKMVDIDGKFKYSEVRTVLFDGNTVLFDVYPNPVITNKLYLQVQQYSYAGKAQAIITDIAGRSIQNSTITLVKGSNQLPITIKNLKSGTYFVTVYDANGNLITQTKKLVKQ